MLWAVEGWYCYSLNRFNMTDFIVPFNLGDQQLDPLIVKFSPAICWRHRNQDLDFWMNKTWTDSSINTWLMKESLLLCFYVLWLLQRGYHWESWTPHPRPLLGIHLDLAVMEGSDSLAINSIRYVDYFIQNFEEFSPTSHLGGRCGNRKWAGTNSGAHTRGRWPLVGSSTRQPRQKPRGYCVQRGPFTTFALLNQTRGITRLVKAVHLLIMA